MKVQHTLLDQERGSPCRHRTHTEPGIEYRCVNVSVSLIFIYERLGKGLGVACVRALVCLFVKRGGEGNNHAYNSVTVYKQG
jgi:hypothetical protein